VEAPMPLRAFWHSESTEKDNNMTEKKQSGIDIIVALDNKIKEVYTDSLDISLGELANKHREKELIINPDFQRLFRWSEEKQSRFIESLLLKLPIPPFFFIENNDRTWELVDGLQRISSYLHFIGELPDKKGDYLELNECDIVPELNNLKYNDLPTALQLTLKNRYIRIEVIRKGSDKRLRYDMFKRLNTGGEKLSEQEIRNSTIRILDAKFNEFIVRLSKDENFGICTSTLTEEKLSEKYNEELVLRFFAFKNNKKNYKHDVSDFMTKYMEEVSDPIKDVTFDYATEEAIFLKTFKILKENLGEYAFSRTNENGNYVLAFIVYHYEAFALGIQKHLRKIDVCNPKQMKKIKDEFELIKRDKDFRNITTGGGRNTPRYLNERISFVETRVGNVI
jgi:hypothetical protein